MKGNDDKLNRILRVGESKLNKLKVALGNIQNSLENCHDSQAPDYDNADGHDANVQKEGFKELVVKYVEEQLGLKGDNSQVDSRPSDLDPLRDMFVK